MLRMKTWLIILLSLIVLAGGGVAAAWGLGWFDTGVHSVRVDESTALGSVAGNLNEAIALATAAKNKLRQWPGYHCVYLRDELIDKEMQKNSLLLTVMHEPFSVIMEWVEPKSKQGRKAVYATGKNDGKMRVKIGFLKMSLDLQESVTRKESRHTLEEAGLLNLMNRFVKSWEEEKEAGETNTKYSNVNLTPEVSGKQYKYACRLIETDHPLSAKGKYPFHRVKIYFDKASGLPVRMQGFDWPAEGQTEGALLEEYSYYDVKATRDLKASDFDL